MTRRACIYCRRLYRAAALTAEPVLPAALGGRLTLKRATCPSCAAGVQRTGDDFLSGGFAPTVAALAGRSGRRAATPDAPADDWRLAHRAAARILYCYLLLELGEAALSSPAAETLRRHVSGGAIEGLEPSWEVTPALHSPSPRWHVLMFDTAPPSRAAVGLFGTIWFRYRLDLDGLAPHGRLLTLDAIGGARGMAALRHRGAWRHRPAVRFAWKG